MARKTAAIGWLRIAMVVIAAMFLVKPSPGFADTPAQALQRFGYIGTWSADCAKDDVPRVTLSISTSGKPTWLLIQPHKLEALWEIDTAEIVAEDKIKITRHLTSSIIKGQETKFANMEPIVVVTIKKEHKIRTMDEYRLSNHSWATAKEGFIYTPDQTQSHPFTDPTINTGKPTPFLEKCLNVGR